MQSLKVGHYTHNLHGTGASVFLFDAPKPAAYCLAGASPASSELHTLDLDAAVPSCDGLVFLGGSAFGLGAVSGALQWFKEQNRGYPMPHARVPIVPAAAIYDLGVGSAHPPTAEDVYQACKNAVSNNDMQGRIGAGTGASVGKCIVNTKHMSGGVGFAEIHLANGLHVLAYVVVNSVGDVRDKEGRIIAGAYDDSGNFVDCETYLLSGKCELIERAGNTTLAAVFTNAAFSKIELKRIAKMAIAGMARAISPVFTHCDGDILFCASLGNHSASELTVGTMAVEVVRQAIVNAVSGSVVLLG